MHLPPRLQTLFMPLIALLLTTLLGCGDENALGQVGTSGAGELGAHEEGAGMRESGDADLYVAGLTKEGEHGLRVILRESSPEPKYIGKYTWTLEVQVDKDGGIAAVYDADIVATPTMPAHGHGTVPPTTLGVGNGLMGVWELNAMDLFMAGTWQIDIKVTCEDPWGRFDEPLESEVTFSFELEG